MVASTNPTTDAVNVPLNQVISATFNEKINASTITQASFTLQSNQSTAKIAGTVSYDDATSTLKFAPALPLIINTTYTGTVSSSIKDPMGNAMQADYIWSFSTGATIAPLVISTDPANNATNVIRNKIVAITFNGPMDPTTINNATFTLKQGNNVVTGSISYQGNAAYFQPSALLNPNALYTATMSAGAKNMAGTSIPNDYVWTFTTGSAIAAPTVVLTDPAPTSTDVAINKPVTASFNTAMDPSTINGTTFTLKENNVLVVGTVSYSGVMATFTPSTNLLAGTFYTATVTTGAKNLAGIPMANNYVWTFTTSQSTSPTVILADPANNSTGVSLNKTERATFSMAMDPATINSTTFTLKQGNNPIPGAVSYSGTTAVFSPAANLLPNTLYNATITTGAKNIAGTPLANNYVWSFTTGSTIAPTVTQADPANNSTGVSLNKKESATFSMAMDPTTINSNTLILKQGNNPVTGSVSYSGNTAVFSPSLNLLPNTIYTVTVTTGAKNLAGVPLANNYVWSFTTGSPSGPSVTSTDPANKETGVALNKVISASFNTAMDPLTITSATFTVKQGTTSVSGSVSYSGTKASFTPSANLLSDNTYTATITTGAKDMSGNPLANDYIWTFSTMAHTGPQAPDLKSVERFGIIAGTGITNNAGFSVIHDMDVGIYPGVRASVTGFPPATIVNGAIYASDDLLPVGVAAMLKQAKLDLTNAYLSAEGASSPAPATVSGDQGGKTLAPGIYKSTSTLGISSGDLTLDAKGDINAVWIFQIASGFTTKGGAGGNVILTGGAQAANVYWQVGSSATIGDNTIFKGNILAYTSITMNSGSTATGRMLTINAAVTLTDTNFIYKP